ncbi:MAG: hypothetical protein ACM3YE_02155 [Bacteroidota bacterium]
MLKNISDNELSNFGAKLIDFNDLKTLKRKKDTAEIVRFIAQQICQDCIDEYYKIKSNLMNE